jgi:hypothetical protein
MKRRSSAYKIAYDVRPAKQTERRVLLDILKKGSEAGLELSTYQYLGFGGFKFYDFEMLFRHLGIANMTSVELDRSIVARCRFNKPFEFIEVEQCALADYLGRVIFSEPVIAWLDYDDWLSKKIVDDVVTLGAKAPTGSFVFITVDARMPEGYRNRSIEQRILDLREELQSFSLSPSAGDVEPDNFPRYAERVLSAALMMALSRRSDGVCVPLLRVFYGDTTLMITVGACLCPNEQVATKLKQLLRAELAFLLPRRNASPYTIPPFNFTMRERHMLDTIVTTTKESKKARKKLRSITITQDLVEDYRRMVRFVPKYFETYI